MRYLPELPPTLPTRSPTRLDLLGESRIAWEWLQTQRLGKRILQGLPSGQNQPVLLLPGYGANERYMQPLYNRLQRLGYAPRHWQQGTNTGAVHKLVPKLSQLLTEWQAEIDQPITLIGWSLGGYIARELARDLPETVGGVITLGSPAVGGPKYTITAKAYQKKGFDLDAIEREMAVRDAIPIQCPLTVLFSKQDGIVSWPATLDRLTPQARHVQVKSSHLGLIYDGQVFRAIAQALSDQQIGKR